MFDIGASELAVIGVTALLVVGPERLPRLARIAGLYVGRARRVMSQMRAEVQRELDEQDLQSIRHIVQRGAIDWEDEPARPAPEGAVDADAARRVAPPGAADAAEPAALSFAQASAPKPPELPSDREAPRVVDDPAS